MKRCWTKSKERAIVDVIDLSHFISEAMPVFPGTEPPKIMDACTIAKNGFAEKLLSLYSHTGTHIDAPGHILAGAATLDQFTAGRFIGPGCAVNVSACRGRAIEINDLQKEEARIARAEFVLLCGGWSKNWGGPAYFAPYPVLTEAAARWLAGFQLKGVGVDTISVDGIDSTALAVHKILFSKNLLVIENLTCLETLIGKEFIFSCLPLKIAASDGSPVRAVAWITR